ncbi:MAG: translation initiation factor IF-2 N-terminal domain-containing protein, partial [Terracidiphilus sp.]
MSKVRINDLAREMEVKSKQILDILVELGLDSGKTHSSSLEDYEAEKVRAQFERGSRSGGQGAAAPSRASQVITPKIDLSHISKPGDVLKAILANKQREEQEARQSHLPPAPVRTAPPAPVPPPAPPVATAPPQPLRPEPRKVVPQPRSAPPIVVPPAQPAIASRPPTGPVVAKAPAGSVAPVRPVVVVAPPPAAVVVKPPTAPVAPP